MINSDKSAFDPKRTLGGLLWICRNMGPARCGHRRMKTGH